MIGAEAFGPDFQRTLVRLCMDDYATRSLVGRFIQAGQLGWTDPTSAWAWRIVAQDERGMVTRLQIETEGNRLAPQDPARLGLYSLTQPGDARDLDFVRAQVVEWARQQTFRLAFNEAADAWNRGDIATAQATMLRRIEEIQGMATSIADRGWFFEEFGARQAARTRFAVGQDTFPSGIEKLDRAMNDGLQKGQIEIPIAYSGIGKTFWAVQRGFIGARLRQRVLHFVLEGGRRKTEDRYEARFMECLYHDVRTGNIELDRMIDTEAEYNVLRGCLVLRGTGDRDAWAFSYDDILAEMAELRRSRGWVPDMIVVDYGDLLNEPGENERERQKAAYRKLKHLSERVGDAPGQYGYAVVSPSQAQRPDKGADEREHILRPRDIADCYEKVRVADVIISLNRTVDEKEAGQARICLGKYRDDEDGIVVRVSTDYTRGGFCKFWAPEPEAPKKKEKEDKKEKDKVVRRPAEKPLVGPPPVVPPPPPPPGVP